MWDGGKQDIVGSLKSIDFMWGSEEGFYTEEWHH